MVRKKIEIPIYYGDLIIIQAKNWKEVNKKYGTKANKEFDAITFKNEKKSGYTEYVVAFINKPKGEVIAHEVTHLVNHIFIDRLMQLDAYNDEPQAYLTGFIFAQIEKFFNKIKKQNGRTKTTTKVRPK